MKRLLLTTALFCALLTSTTPVSSKQYYSKEINQVAEMYGVAPELIQAMIFYESNYNPNEYSDVGAIGLMQVVPRYNRDRMSRLGVTDLYDPYSNILVGVDLLMEYSEEMDVYEALTAYNCGKYSKTLEKVKAGGSWEYADKILAYSEQLERNNNK